MNVSNLFFYENEVYMFGVIARTTIMFVLMMFAMRMMGKKNLGEFQPNDLVSTILISNLTSLVLEAPELPIFYSIIPILLIMCYEVFLSIASKKSDKISILTQGSSKVLILNGVINQNVMQDLRLTVNDILEGMRNNSVFYLEEISLAIIETTGAINIYPNPKFDEILTKSDIPPLAVIKNGKLSKSFFNYNKIDKSEIDNILKVNNLTTKDILLMTIDGNSHYNITKKEI